MKAQQRQTRVYKHTHFFMSMFQTLQVKQLDSPLSNNCGITCSRVQVHLRASVTKILKTVAFIRKHCKGDIVVRDSKLQRSLCHHYKIPTSPLLTVCGGGGFF